MARNCLIQALRTTRSALDTNAGSSNLNAGEFYWITDEDVLAVGTSTSTYVDVGPGGGDVVDDTTPQLGGTLDANGHDIDMGVNHLICDQRIAEHDGDSNTYVEFHEDDGFRVVGGGTVALTIDNLDITAGRDIDTGSYHLICDEKIAEHKGDTDTYLTFGGLDSFAIYTGGIVRYQIFNGAHLFSGDIDLGFNHLVCEQRIAEHDGDSDTAIEFHNTNSFRVVCGGQVPLVCTSSGTFLGRDLDMGFYHLIGTERIAEHYLDTDTHIDFPGNDQWSVTVGGTEMLEVGTGGVDIDGPCRYRADITNVGTGTGTTTIGSTETGKSYYAPTSILNTRSFQLNSATVGTQIQVFKNGAGTVQFTQGTSQTIIQGNNWKLDDKTAAHAICVATNTWFVTGNGGP